MNQEYRIAVDMSGPTPHWIMTDDGFRIVASGRSVEREFKRRQDQAAPWWKRITG